jgi:hypothetical protein
MTSFFVQTGSTALATGLADGSAGRMLGRIVGLVRHRFGRAARAQERRRAGEAVGADTMRDTGVAPEMATGIRTWQADLPFFMQSGFGK